MGNVVLVLSGITLSLFGFIVVFIRLKAINVIDVYIFYLCQYYGLLSVFDGISNDYSGYDISYIIFIHVLVFCAVQVLFILSKIYRKEFFAFLDFWQLIYLNGRLRLSIIRLFTISILISFLVIREYLFKSYYGSLLEENNANMLIGVVPYWVSTIIMLFDPFFFYWSSACFFATYSRQKKR